MKGYEARIKTKDGRSHVYNCGTYVLQAWNPGDYRACILDGKEPFPLADIEDVIIIPKEIEL